MHWVATDVGWTWSRLVNIKDYRQYDENRGLGGRYKKLLLLAYFHRCTTKRL
jgi:hypothetical protein